jgi:hypothetical protein
MVTVHNRIDLRTAPGAFDERTADVAPIIKPPFLIALTGGRAVGASTEPLPRSTRRGLRLVAAPNDKEYSPSLMEECRFFSVRYDARPEWLKSAHRLAGSFCLWLNAVSHLEDRSAKAR